ncbi:tetratricopeptide repeat protein [candidate division KSB1 bacterium]|nr:tetratricopeptide repeat protein [candidate division KSB1 bacterium]
MKNLYLLLIIVIFALNFQQISFAQPIDSLIIQGKTLLEQCINEWQLPRLLNTRAHFERLLTLNQHKWLIHYYLALTDLRIVDYLFSKNALEDKKLKADAEKYTEEALEHLEKSIELKEDFPENYALKSNLLGKKIAFSPMKAIYLGPRSGIVSGKAMELGGQNPRVNLLIGISTLYTPTMFGGGADKALTLINQSIAIFDASTDTVSIMPDWGKAEAYGYQGMIFMQQEKYPDARQSFQKALEINPQYGWVKYHLMKQLEEKVAGK